ncbi:MAG: thiamine diphosphokinase [Alistipes sp.]|nr:thiamine diphosphokinase [Alistipes sp.]
MEFKNKITLGFPDPDTAHTVILADGDFPSQGYAREILDGAKRVVCCDGAADTYIYNGGTPAAIVGDLDSVSDGTRASYAAILHRDTDQETNDLTKAVRYCAENYPDETGDILILGATGKREDHTIGNISLLRDYNTFYGFSGRVRMVTGLGIIDHIGEDSLFGSFCGQQVTILCLDPATRITTHNLKYSLHRANLRAWWQGTLNESLGDTFGIGTDGDTFVYRLF